LVIVSRTPWRISIGGGGTDLPSYYERYGSFFISAAIDKYTYVHLQKTAQRNFITNDSQPQVAEHVGEIEHPFVREAYKLHGMAPHFAMNSMADLPSGTGLGSSGSFGVGILRAIYAHKGQEISPTALAEEACHIEINLLKEPVGKQDQYIAAHGGITCFEIDTGGQVFVSPLEISSQTLGDLQENLALFFTGYSRRASPLLAQQQTRIQGGDRDFLDNLHFIKDLGLQIKKVLEAGRGRDFGALLDAHWQRKTKLGAYVSNGQIDEWYELGMKSGALGGKLIGAGGGGFLLFYTQDRIALRNAMQKAGIAEVKFAFDFEGSKVLV
jgi:D-glycero-alpha-D-manno-heptose-7-phosphate kinase